MPTLRDIAHQGQSVWIDTLSREMLTSGELQALIDQGVMGATANPTILEKAITGSDVYDDDIWRLAMGGLLPEEIYEALAIDMVGHAADLFRPVYDATNGMDGFVSLEVSPRLAYDTAATIQEARRLFTALKRPNVLIKVPATAEGMPAIEQLISEGVNVNITLMFSLGQYQDVAEAYLTGLERRLRADEAINRVASVASFFVSRIDTMVDKRLAEINEQALQGKIAIASAKLAYVRFQAISLASARWRALADLGARVQRPLWASTGTKNPRYSDTMYVDELIGPLTVNTMPLATLRAFLDHGSVSPRLEVGVDEAQFQLAKLSELQIDLSEITAQLVSDGVDLFTKSYDHLIAYLREKSARFRQERAA